jgi:autotransporter passenger strand-loop-strand repeat protein
MDVFSSGILVVSSGVTSTGVEVIQEAELHVQKGGIAYSAAAADGGSVVISNGGILLVCTVSNDGELVVLNGGYAQTITVDEGGLYTISSGGTGRKSVVLFGGSLCVQSDALAAGVSVMDGGEFHVSKGAYADTPVVETGGMMTLSSGGVADSATISGSADVNAGGELNNATVLNGGQVTIQSKGYADAAAVSSGGGVTVLKGGTLNFASVYANGTIAVDGGVCGNVTISGGTVNISGGGTANKTTVNSDGKLNVSSGGTANSTTVNSGGSLTVSNGGTANNTTINYCGWFVVASGGTATDLNIVSGAGFRFELAPGTCITGTVSGSAIEAKNGVFSNGELNPENVLLVFSGGTAVNPVINRYGALGVSSGGEAIGVVENGGSVDVLDGANVTFTSNTFSGLVLAFYKQSATVHSGTTAYGTIVNSGSENDGYGKNNSVSFLVFSDGIANDTTVNYMGKMYVFSGGTANRTTVLSGGSLIVSGGTATIVFNPWQGNISLNNGAKVVYLERDANIYCRKGNEISKADVMDSLNLSSGDEVFIYSGGIINGATVNSGGCLRVSNGGMLTGKMTFDRGANIMVGGGILNFDLTQAEAGSEIALVNDLACVLKDPSFTLTVNDDLEAGTYEYTLAEGASKFNRTISVVNVAGEKLGILTLGETVRIGYDDYTLNLNDSTLSVSIVKPYTVVSSGLVLIDETRTVGIDELYVDTAVSSGGKLIVNSDGTASGTTVNPDGSLSVSSGGTADNTTVNSNGYLDVASGGTANSTTVNSGGVFDIFKSGGADNITINSSGWINVWGGGMAENTTLNGGSMHILSDALVDNTTVNSGGSMYVVSGGTADKTTVNFAGRFFVTGIKNGGTSDLQSGGTANSTTINSRGKMDVSKGGTANCTTVNSRGEFSVGSDGTVNDTIVNEGSMSVNYGGMANNTILNGGMIVVSGLNGIPGISPIANNTTVNSGDFKVCCGGAANGVTVKKDGSLLCIDGGILTGRITFDSRAAVGMDSVSVLDFDLTQAAETEALVNNLSIIHGMPQYALTVSDEQEKGEYILAEGASGFDSVITVRNTLGESIGTLTVDGTLETDNRQYALSLTDDILSLTCYALIKDRTISSETVSVTPYEVFRNPVVNSGGNLYVSSGATASEIKENGGYVYVAAGAEANFVPNTINDLVLDRASATIHSGTTANNTTVNIGGYLNVSNGGTANSTTVNYGTMYVSSSGVANSTKVNKGGRLYVSSDGTANEISENGGYVEVETGANAMFASNTFSGLILSNASATIHSGTTANSTMLMRGQLNVYSGGTANSTTVNSGGSLNVSSGGTANNTTVNSSGWIYVSSGGTAIGIKENGGYVSFADGADVSFAANSFSGLILSQCSAIIHSGTTANRTTLIQNGRLFVSSGGTANATVIDSFGSMSVSSGGIANDTIVNSKGYLDVFSGGTVNRTSIYNNSTSGLASSTVMNIFCGGTANDTVIDCGLLYVSSGGTASNTVLNWGEITVTSDGVADGVTVNGAGGLRITSGGTALNIKECGGVVNITNGASVTFVSNTFSGLRMVRDSATIHSGTTAVATVINYKNAYFHIFSGGVAEKTVINSGGSIIISSGGTANNTLINSGRLFVSSGGTADGTIVNPSCLLTVSKGGMANSTTLNGGRMFVSNGGTANSVIVNVGEGLSIYNGGTATNIIENGGYVSVPRDADVTFASHTIYDLTLNNKSNTTVHSGTTVCNVFLDRSARTTLELFSGGKLTGRIMASGGMISAHDGAIIDFDLTSAAPGATARIVSMTLNKIQGTPIYTITVNADQTEGVYTLAEGADEFNQTISVVNTAGADLGTLTVGETASISGVDYTLSLSEEGILSLKVGETETLSPYTSDGLVVQRGNRVSINSGQVFHDALFVSGSMTVNNGAILNEVNVNSNCSLNITSGATATNIVENGGYVSVADGAEVSFVPHAFTLGNTQVFYGTATVHSGTTAFNISGGTFHIYSGGVANNNTGTFYVYNGGVANNNVGIFCIHSGGVANSTNVGNRDGISYVSSGGTANGTIFSGGTIFLSGGTANDTFFDYSDGSAYIIVAGGGTANDTEVRGYPPNSNWRNRALVVCSGGTANHTTLYAGGHLHLWHGIDLNGGFGCGVANDTTVNSGGRVEVESGTANRTTVNNGGVASVYSNGTANDTIVNSGGRFIVENGSATGIVENGGYVVVRMSDIEDGTFVANTINGLILCSNSATIHSGTTANSTTITSGGYLYVYSDGMTTDTIVNFGGNMYVSSGGVANDTTVNSGGYLYVSSGGTANVVVINGGRMSVSSGGRITGRLMITGNAFVSMYEEGVLDFDLTQAEAGETALVNDLSIIQGTPLYTLTVSKEQEKGKFILADGAAGFDGTISVQTKIKNNNTLGTLTVGGSLETAYNKFRYSLDLEDDSLIITCEVLYVSQSITNTTSVTEYEVYRNTRINGSGSMIVLSGGIADNTTVSTGGSMLISSGGVANSTTVKGYARESEKSPTALTVFSGGTANSTIISGGRIIVSSGGIANDISVTSGGRIYVSSGGTALDIVWTPCEGYVFIEGGYATFVSEYSGVYYGSDYHLLSHAETMDSVILGNREEMNVMNRGTANNTTLRGGGCVMSVSFGGEANNTTVSANCWVDILSGGVANSTILSKGSMIIFSGGIANDTIVYGKNDFCALSGGIIRNVTITSGGSVEILSGGKLTGLMTFEQGAKAYVSNGAILDFDISELTPKAEARVNNLSPVSGSSSTLYTLTVSEEQGKGTYTLAEGASKFNRTISVVNTAGDELGILTLGETVKIGYDDYTLNLNDSTLSVTVVASDPTPKNLIGTKDRVSWDPTGAAQYVVEYSTDHFEHAIQVVTASSALDLLELPAGTYQWRVKADGCEDWAVGEDIVSDNGTGTAKVLQSNENGDGDVFFAEPDGTWGEPGYFSLALHFGSVNDWTGTREIVDAEGKGRIRNLFFGSSDPNVLCLSDGENGDAIFVDDVYTDSPEDMAKETARLYKIHEIRAGAGDDIVDMTSQRFEYVGDGLTIRGGDGNDVIWANKGDNRLFGDAGDDRIVGASGNDVIAGGIGNDSMHGGGGNDVFTFCDDWGADTVEQLATGTVTLWFADGDESNWDEKTLTYTDGENSVTVTGITVDKITLKFGENSPEDAAQFAALSEMGAFDAFTSQKIFEESGNVLTQSVP